MVHVVFGPGPGGVTSSKALYCRTATGLVGSMERLENNNCMMRMMVCVCVRVWVCDKENTLTVSVCCFYSPYFTY